MDSFEESSYQCVVVPNLGTSIMATSDKPFAACKNDDDTFSCVKCCKTFSSKSATVRHYRKHTGEHPYVCSLCQGVFASKSSLSNHELRIHNLNKEVALSCGECGKLFITRSALETHSRIHSSNKPFQCEHCGKSFTQKICRDIHTSKHTGKYDYQCSICLKLFATRAKLTNHSHVHEEPRYTCEQCGMRFVRKDTLQSHLRTHSRERLFQCCMCSLSFVSQAKLLSHKQIHKGGTECKCKLCCSLIKTKSEIANLQERLITNEVFSNIDCKVLPQTEISEQTSAVATGGPQERCFICSLYHCQLHTKNNSPNSYVEGQTLKSHSYVCHLCPKGFVHKNKLTAHIKTHLEDPSHECNICGKRFYRKDVHARHVALHSNKRTFNCAPCGKTFASKFSLSTHLKTHSSSSSSVTNREFQCKQCGKKYKHKNTFAQHRRTHLGNFNHTCVSCGKKFMKKSHFEGHMRSHSGERPFQCATCGRRFKEKKHCQEHGGKAHSNTLNLASLFASITNENVHVDHMSNIIYSSTQPLPQEEIIGSLSVPEISQELQSALGCAASDTQVSPPLASTFLSPPVQMNDSSVTISTPMSSLVFTNLNPNLQEIQSQNESQFFLTDSDSILNKTNSYDLEVPNNDLSFTILSGEETNSVLSQGI